MAPIFDEVKAWLNKASSDLCAAQILVEYSTLALGPAAFHCQQTAGKALKAFLIFKMVSFDRVHNLVYLLDLCETAAPGFATLREAAERLTPYAVEVRYPGDMLEVSTEEARQALVAAQAIWNQVLSLLPRALHPSITRDSSV